jgi:DNA-binding response OmpR family regulator
MTATIPFIFLSAKAERGDLRQGMELGADDYVTKPCTPDELLGAIAARLKRQTAITQPYTVALRQAAERLNHLLYYDNITNLPNRLLLRERFSQIIGQQGARERARRVQEQRGIRIYILTSFPDPYQRIFLPKLGSTSIPGIGSVQPHQRGLRKSK